jgi:hypothetical protein
MIPRRKSEEEEEEEEVAVAVAVVGSGERGGRGGVASIPATVPPLPPSPPGLRRRHAILPGCQESVLMRVGAEEEPLASLKKKEWNRIGKRKVKTMRLLSFSTSQKQ